MREKHCHASKRFTMVLADSGPFDERIEKWSSHAECFDWFVTANGVEDEKIVSSISSVIGPNTVKVL